MHLVAALARQIEGDLGDAVDLMRRVNLRIYPALLAALERHDLLRLAEIDATGELAHDEDVEAFDELALQGACIRECRIADRGTQVGEQVEILAQAQKARFGAMLIGDVVPLGSADRTEDDGVGLLRLGDGFVGDGHAVFVIGGAADEIGSRSRIWPCCSSCSGTR